MMSSITDLANYKPNSVPELFWKADIANAAVTGIDPYLMAAIARQETGYGSLGAGRPSQGEYVLGYGYPAPGQGNPTYSGLNNQLYYGGKQLASFLGGRPVTAATVREIGFQSWKPEDKAGWANNVWKFYTQLKSEAKQPITGSTGFISGDAGISSYLDGQSGITGGDAGISSALEGVDPGTGESSSTSISTSQTMFGKIAYYATLIIIALVAVFFTSRIFR